LSEGEVMNRANDKILDDSLGEIDIQLRMIGDEKNYIKKPFRKVGILIIIISVLCLLLMSQLPWAYVKYDSKQNENKSVEEVIFSDTSAQDLKENSFFESENGSQNVGILLDDFTNIYRMSYYLLIGLIVMGVIITLYQIITMNKGHLYDLDLIFNSIVTIIAAVIGIEIISLFIRLIGAHFLFFHNSLFIAEAFPNIHMILVLPFAILVITAVFLKISFTILKMNFKKLEKIHKYDSSKKAIYSFKKGAYNE